MKHVGFMGGSSFTEMGTADEMNSFFVFFQSVASTPAESKLVDNLYRKYLTFDELDEMRQLINRIKNELSVNFINTYSRYFSAIETCIESSQMFYASWNIYQPLKTVITDIPFVIDEKNRPLEEYDKLSGSDLPFWLR